LGPGSRGAAVKALEDRLLALGYWLETPDGEFDTSTEHAVVAFQKTHDLERDGIVGPRTQAALATATRIPPHRAAGTHFEVDLRRQLLLSVRDGKVAWIFDTSTGNVPGSTPPGRWRVYTQYDGYQHGRLGTLYRPKYFHDNVAIHGFSRVPPYPASHGCVRVTNAAMDFLWATDALPIGTDVWVY
jgi:hypothetical protein